MQQYFFSTCCLRSERLRVRFLTIVLSVVVIFSVGCAHGKINPRYHPGQEIVMYMHLPVVGTNPVKITATYQGNTLFSSPGEHFAFDHTFADVHPLCSGGLPASPHCLPTQLGLFNQVEATGVTWRVTTFSDFNNPIPGIPNTITCDDTVLENLQTFFHFDFFSVPPDGQTQDRCQPPAQVAFISPTKQFKYLAWKYTYCIKRPDAHGAANGKWFGDWACR